jgi:hypothetical protein
MRINEVTNKNNISDLVNQVHAKYANDPVDACWHATQDLAKLLTSNGVHGFIVKGDVETDWDTIQHHWIVVDDIILDPTVEQLDGDKTIFKDTDPFYEKYDAENAEWTAF